MKFIIMDEYPTAAILLIATGAVLVVLAIITNRGDITTAAVVISGMVCVMTGIFVMTFSGDEPISPRLVGILPAQGCINLCHVASDLGITGNAYFLPPRVTGKDRVMQFNPLSTYNGTEVSAKGSFPETEPGGLITIPSCDPLIQDLRKRNALVIPKNEENLTHLLREVIEDIFEFAPRVSAIWNGTLVSITFHDYEFIDGCQFIAQESPHCCTLNPCPACSLCGALIAEGTDKVVSLDQCVLSSSSQDVTAIFSVLPVLPLPDGYPQMNVTVAPVDTITSDHIRIQDHLFE